MGAEINPKRLQVFTHHLRASGGHESATLNILTRLAKRGWEIELYSFTLADWPGALPLTWHRIPGKGLPTQLLKTTWFSLAAKFAAKISARDGRPLRLTLGTAVAEADVRVVHFIGAAYLSAVKAGFARPPNPRTFLHRLYQALTLRFFSWNEARLLPRSRALIAVSQRTAREALTLLPASFPVTVIHNAAPPVVSAPPRAESEEPRLLFVGTLERKGIEKALRCLGALSAVPWKLDVIGPGDVARWKSYAQKLGIAERIIFLGERPASSHFGTADLLLFPSGYEPFGLVVAEAAMSLCLPLASIECGAMELWPSRPDWMKLSSVDPDPRWNEALARLLSDRELRRDLASASQDSFSKWDWDQAADRYESVLEAVAEASPPPLTSGYESRGTWRRDRSA